MSYLRQFPISGLKVDRSFITDLDGDQTGTALVLTTVAKGIETPEQFAQVRELGFTLVRGFYISPPLEAAARALAQQAGPLVVTEPLPVAQTEG
ncbi:hypothetical protein DESA109040_17405 [Deinococcus saxicola]|uniref:EAL domain-containing protein n=1 Tax=Deinococcus saxicola TaxID=249406 RepID=UPI0039EEA0D2